MGVSSGVPTALLLEFFHQATAALNELGRIEDSHSTLAELRVLLISKQKECLSSSVSSSRTFEGVSIEDLQTAIAECSTNSSNAVVAASEKMNEAARLAFCRLVLYSEHAKLSEETERGLIDSGEMTEQDALEFCGLCEVCVRVPFVVDHVQNGSALWDAGDETEAVAAPPRRLERIQRIFLNALGYESEFAGREIKRLFCSNDTPPQLRDAMVSMTHTIQAILINCDPDIMTQNYLSEAQCDSDGVTKVVSVQFSERIVDGETGEEVQVGDNAPRSEQMTATENRNFDDDPAYSERRRREQFEMARQASALQQEITRELSAMSEEEREAELKEARDVVVNTLGAATRLPAPERVAYLTGLDSKTQRLMVMHQIWSSSLAAEKT